MSAQIKKIIILAGDIVFLYLSLFLTVYFRYSHVDPEHSSFTTFQLFLVHVWAFTPLILVWLVVFYIHNLYEITSAKNTLEFYTSLIRALVVNFLVAALFFYFANFVEVAPKTNLFIYFGIFVVLFLLWRRQINSILKRRLLVKTVIISGDDSGSKLALKLNQNPQIGYEVVFVGTPGAGVNISELVNKQGIRALIVDGKFLNKGATVTSLYDFVDKIEIVTLDKFNERVWRKVDLEHVNSLWFLNNFATGRRSFYDSAKRFLDFCMSLLLVMPATALGVVISFLIKLEDGGAVFYKQVRVGQKGKLFTLIKFRTMRSDAESKGVQWTVENDKRITRIGKFLRKTRLDEIPQLLNILKGEMSFVGPRAERPEFHQMLVDKIPFYDRRYLVKPGLTGWAQINYTYGSSVEDTKEKISYDFYYLKNRSLIFDIGIVLKTVNIVLSGLGR